MRSSFPRLFALGIAAMVFACGSPERHVAPIPVPIPIPDPPLKPTRDASPIQTDAVTYQLVRGASEYRAMALATYRNSSSEAVYFTRCNATSTKPMWSVGRTGPDSTRRFFTDVAWACVGGIPPGIIAPGESVTVNVRLGSFDQPSMKPPLLPEHLTGLVRIELALCAGFHAEYGACEPLPQAARRSNAIDVHY